MKQLNFKLKVVTCVLAAGFMQGCTKHKDSSVNKDLVKYDLKLDLKSGDDLKANGKSLSGPEQKLAEAINAGESVSFKEVSRLFAYRQSKKYDAAYKQSIQAGISDEYSDSLANNHVHFLELLSAPLKNKNYMTLKSQYEQSIEDKNGQKIVYNRDANLTPYVQDQTKLQCSSGTNLNLLVTRMSREGLDYRAENYVVVFTKGHVQPAQFIRIGDTWNLFAVEATSAGDAIHNLGRGSSLNGCMRVIDADSYMVAELFKGKLQKSAKSALVSNLEIQTAKKYNIDLEKTNATCARGVGSASSDDDSDELFGFGTSNVPAGDQERVVSGVTAAQAQAGIDQEIEYLKTQEICKANPSSCVNLPAVGNINVEYKDPETNEDSKPLIIPYILDYRERGTFAIFVTPAVHESLKTDAHYQCEFLSLISRIIGKGYHWEPISETNDAGIMLSRIDLTIRKDSKTPKFYLNIGYGKISGSFQKYENGIVKLDSTIPENTKNGSYTVRGEAPLLATEDLYQVEQRCMQWQFGHRPNMR